MAGARGGVPERKGGADEAGDAPGPVPDRGLDRGGAGSGPVPAELRDAIRAALERSGGPDRCEAATLVDRTGEVAAGRAGEAAVGGDGEIAGGRAAEVSPGVSERYARAALAELDRLLARGEKGRAAALELLAADACLVAAFEAAAEEGADLRELAERLGPRGALGRRLQGIRQVRDPSDREGTSGKGDPC